METNIRSRRKKSTLKKWVTSFKDEHLSDSCLSEVHKDIVQDKYKNQRSSKNSDHRKEIEKFNATQSLTNEDMTQVTNEKQNNYESSEHGNRLEGDWESCVSSKKINESGCFHSIVQKSHKRLQIDVELDGVAIILFVFALCTRFYRLKEPPHIVFDELHFGKYIGLYMKKIFFFDLHPPLGKLIISAVGYYIGFDGMFKFDRIGSLYDTSVPIFALRFVPALSGSLLIPISYFVMLELGCEQWTSVLAAVLLLCDNALLTQSRFILMEPMLLLFMFCGILFLLKFLKIQQHMSNIKWWIFMSVSCSFFTFALSVKYVGLYSWFLALSLIWYDFWEILSDKTISDCSLVLHAIARSVLVFAIPLSLYLSVFYLHLSFLTKAGPHDSVMTSAFQASLEGGLASITKGQPLEVAHGSQITLRHTHGKACWLHSHTEVYPIRYPDKRGSSHQQQVTCYTFKDLNNWWIVRRPGKSNLVVSHPPDAIKDGDIIHLIHGITGRPLNSHDVSAPMSPHNQEVSCYIDYNISMAAQNLWKVDIINREVEGDEWHTIQSQVRLIHVNSSQALKYSGRQLPDWGFHQMEIVTDKITVQDDTIWNVEEHRYTKIEDEKERERDLINAEMIPLKTTSLSFWSKFSELQYKMLFPSQETSQNHMYSSEPIEWPLLTRGIAYWVSSHHNGQVHLLGNIIIWYSGTLGIFVYFFLLIFYLMRRRRLCFDMSEDDWEHFKKVGYLLFNGFLFHYLPYFFVDRTLFLHHYLPAFTFKVLLLAAVIEHIHKVTRPYWTLYMLYNTILVLWFVSLMGVFKKFCVLSYGVTPLTSEDIFSLRWKESWDFIIHTE